MLLHKKFYPGSAAGRILLCLIGERRVKNPLSFLLKPCLLCRWLADITFSQQLAVFRLHDAAHAQGADGDTRQFSGQGVYLATQVRLRAVPNERYRLDLIKVWGQVSLPGKVWGRPAYLPPLRGLGAGVIEGYIGDEGSIPGMITPGQCLKSAAMTGTSSTRQNQATERQQNGSAAYTPSYKHPVFNNNSTDAHYCNVWCFVRHLVQWPALRAHISSSIDVTPLQRTDTSRSQYRPYLGIHFTQRVLPFLHPQWGTPLQNHFFSQWFSHPTALPNQERCESFLPSCVHLAVVPPALPSSGWSRTTGGFSRHLALLQPRPCFKQKFRQSGEPMGVKRGRYRPEPECKGRGKREIPEKTRVKIGSVVACDAPEYALAEIRNNAHVASCLPCRKQDRTANRLRIDNASLMRHQSWLALATILHNLVVSVGSRRLVTVYMTCILFSHISITVMKIVTFSRRLGRIIIMHWFVTAFRSILTNENVFVLGVLDNSFEVPRPVSSLDKFVGSDLTARYSYLLLLQCSGGWLPTATKKRSCHLQVIIQISGYARKLPDPSSAAVEEFLRTVYPIRHKARLQIMARISWGHGGWAVRPLASHHCEPGSIPGRFIPDFHKWESCRTMPLVDGFFSGISLFPRPFIPALLRTHITSPSSALKTTITVISVTPHSHSRSVATEEACGSGRRSSHPGLGCSQRESQSGTQPDDLEDKKTREENNVLWVEKVAYTSNSSNTRQQNVAVPLVNQCLITSTARMPIQWGTFRSTKQPIRLEDRSHSLAQLISQRVRTYAHAKGTTKPFRFCAVIYSVHWLHVVTAQAHESTDGKTTPVERLARRSDETTAL
ncbi:hypothetical protein PR048_023085 [Dryococelus australis]|uniref:Uncharacterized protein n=1 Tax=Dryococelus australis TaxID=614101 RepID=A0ABQ9GT48_9NEOP|nr:hypothetical protein PR048_023085 [Dryococelus australis]